MLKRAWVKWIAAVLVAAGLLGVWTLRPGQDRSMQDVVTLKVETDCDSAQRACVARGDDLELELRLGPPLRTLESFEIRLRRVRGTLDAHAQVELQFQMRAMDMGLNRYRLLTDADGVWRGRAMLPVCSAGRSDWTAQLDISVDGRRWRAEFPFTVAPR